MQPKTSPWALPPVIKIYLAGGMRSNWQDKVIERFKNYSCILVFIDPREHGYSEEDKYTAWDLEGVANCDIVFGYLEADNPSGAGLALEFGYARGMQRAGTPAKRIIFVDEPSFPQNRYFGMARACADVVVDTLQEGLNALAATIDGMVQLQ